MLKLPLYRVQMTLCVSVLYSANMIRVLRFFSFLKCACVNRFALKLVCGQQSFVPFPVLFFVVNWNSKHRFGAEIIHNKRTKISNVMCQQQQGDDILFDSDDIWFKTEWCRVSGTAMQIKCMNNLLNIRRWVEGNLEAKENQIEHFTFTQICIGCIHKRHACVTTTLLNTMVLQEREICVCVCVENWNAQSIFIVRCAYSNTTDLDAIFSFHSSSK